MKHFDLFVFPVGISAGLMSMLLLVMMMPSSIDGIKITVKEQILNKLSPTKTNTRIKTNTITVEVNPSDTVKDLKKKIKNVGGMEPRMQRLELKKPNGMGIELKDSETMTHYGIEEGTTVLLFKNSEITVVTADDKSANGDYQFTIYVNGRDKVEDLKKQIMKTLEKKSQTNLGTDFRRFTLQYGENGDYDVLKDGKTIDDYPIKKCDTIHLSIGEFEIFVQFEKMNELKTYIIWVKREETVAILKKKIQYMNGIESEEQILKLDIINGPFLKDKNTLKDYAIGKDSTIILSINYEITVTSDEQIFNQLLTINTKTPTKTNTITVEVNGTDKVEDLKKMISNQSGFDPDDQILKCNAANGPEMEDKKTFNKYGIGNGTTIFLSVKFEITVTADEHIFDKLLHLKTYTITVKVNGTQKVEDLKKNIMEKRKKKIKTKLGNDHKRLTLQYGQNDDILRDGQIINGYGIKKGDTVHLSIGEFQIVVQYQKEDEVKTYPIWVKSEETVAILKKKIQNESGIQLEQQTLKYNTSGRAVLEDKNTLKDYAIGKDSTITLYRNFEIKVEADKMIVMKLKHSWTIAVKVIRTDKVEALKKTIMEKLPESFKTNYEIGAQKISLEYGDNDDYYILNDGETIYGYGIRKDDTVRLSIGEFEIVVQYQKEDEVENYPIWVKSEETVAILKKKIQNESGFDPDDQILLCNATNGTEMEDKNALKNYDIRNGKTFFCP